jgi:ADP-heptose:LPS heptosyltransferase
VDDLDELAALIGALDIVASVQTATVHLAGALGKPVWVAIPAVAEWRYLERGETMPWYPSARLFRQERTGEWGPVMERIGRELPLFARGRF